MSGTKREANEGGMCRADFVAPCTHNRWRSLAGFSRHDVVVVNEVLCRANVRPADHGNEPGYLAARDKAKRAAVGASEHGPVGIVVLAHLPGVLENEQSTGAHLFGDPFAQEIDFCDHRCPSSE